MDVGLDELVERVELFERLGRDNDKVKGLLLGLLERLLDGGSHDLRSEPGVAELLALHGHAVGRVGLGNLVPDHRHVVGGS